MFGLGINNIVKYPLFHTKALKILLLKLVRQRLFLSYVYFQHILWLNWIIRYSESKKCTLTCVLK